MWRRGRWHNRVEGAGPGAAERERDTERARAYPAEPRRTWGLGNAMNCWRPEETQDWTYENWFKVWYRTVRLQTPKAPPLGARKQPFFLSPWGWRLSLRPWGCQSEGSRVKWRHVEWRREASGWIKAFNESLQTGQGDTTAWPGSLLPNLLPDLHYQECSTRHHQHTHITRLFLQFSSVQSLSHVQLFATPWTTACPASLSNTNSWNLPKPMSIESVMPSNHLILCRPLLLLPSIFPSIRIFSNESALCIRWPKYWSLSFNISSSNKHLGLISFRMDWLDLLAFQGTLKSLL